MTSSKAVFAAAALSLAVAAGAEEPQQVYESLFGEDARRASVTPGSADDAQLADRLLEAAKTVPASPKLQRLLLEKACEFGMRGPEGHFTAVRAMEMLAEAFPDRAGAAREKILEVRQLQYKHSPPSRRVEYGQLLIDALLGAAHEKRRARQAGEALPLYANAARVASYLRLRKEADTIADLIKIAQAQDAEEREIAVLERRLEADPDDQVAAAKLCTAYLVHQNDPPKALALLDKAAPDEATRTYLPLAAKDLHEVPPAACGELGQWLATLAKDASITSRGDLMLRALGCLERYCDVAAEKDATFIRMQLGIGELARELKLDRAGKVVTIRADAEQGWVIGQVRPNTRITLAYVSGTWQSWGADTAKPGAAKAEKKAKLDAQSPDDPGAAAGDKCRLVLAECGEEGGPGKVLVTIPPGTGASPFTYLVTRPIDTLILRICDQDGDYKKNKGTVKYSLAVVRYF